MKIIISILIALFLCVSGIFGVAFIKNASKPESANNIETTLKEIVETAGEKVSNINQSSEYEQTNVQETITGTELKDTAIDKITSGDIGIESLP